MLRNLLKVFAADAVLLVALYYVFQDLGWRTSFAASLHSACPSACGYTPSFSYGILTRVCTMSGHGVILNSAITLDWVQVLSLVLIAVNAWFIYDSFWKGRMGARAHQREGPPSPPQTVPGSPPA